MAGKRLILICVLAAAAAVMTLSPAYAAAPAPTVSIVSPMHGTSASPSAISNSPTGDGFKVMVNVWNDVSDITAVSVGYCPSSSDPSNPANWTWSADNSTPSVNYDCGTNCGTYEFNMSIPADDYYLQARASSSADGMGYSSDQRTGNDAMYSYIKLLDSKKGTGTLLTRDNSSRFCMDCHAKVVSHGSQTTDTTYGNWQTVCLDCHTPHSTTNLYLIKEQIMTPNSGLKAVVFRKTSINNTPGSYVDADAGASTQALCQVCHTQTGGGTPRWRNSGTTSTHYYDSKCTGCHFHDGGFKGSGDCDSCHGFPPKAGDGKDPIGGSGGKGAHVALNGAHVDEASLPDPSAATYGPGLTQCYVCHPMDDSSHPQGDGAADIAIGVANRFDGTTFGGIANYLGVSGESDNSTPKTCSNVNCHFGAETPRWSCPGDE